MNHIHFLQNRSVAALLDDEPEAPPAHFLEAHGQAARPELFPFQLSERTLKRRA